MHKMPGANYQPSEWAIVLRNDIDVIAVKANCTFIGFEDSSYNGAQIKLPSKPYDRSQFLSKLLNASSRSPVLSFIANLYTACAFLRFSTLYQVGRFRRFPSVQAHGRRYWVFEVLLWRLKSKQHRRVMNNLICDQIKLFWLCWCV